MQRVILLLVCLGLVMARSQWSTNLLKNNFKVEKVSTPSKSLMTPIKDIKGRIINGKPANDGQFPWQAALNIITSAGITFCGGSLISQEWILSTAHCVVDGLQVNVFLGSARLESSQVFSVRFTVYHGDYNQADLSNDISAIQLTSTVQLSANIQTIPRADSAIGPGAQVTLSGFGKTSDDATDVSPVLNYISLTTISDAVCASYYGGGIPAGVVCAEGLDKESSCDGDSGSPLIVGSGQSAVQVGISSFGRQDGCENGIPTGYTRVAYFADWIQSALDRPDLGP